MITSSLAPKSGAASLQKALLCSVSVIAWGIVAAPPPARAQTVSTSTASTVTSTGENIYVNPNVDLTGNPGISNATITATISSQGTIAGAGKGIDNAGTIGTLSNLSPGTITTSGDNDGIYSQGSITSLINSGLIAAASAIAVYNQTGSSIATLTNSGTLTGDTGLSNQGVFGTATNAEGGTIAGSLYGIYSNGNFAALINDAGATISGVSTAITVESHTISALTNNGLVTGTIGFDNLNGTVINLTNDGTVLGSLDGIRNDEAIGTILNQAGGTITGDEAGVVNLGSITGITNGGMISGQAAIDNIFSGTIGTIHNTGVISSTDLPVLNYGQIATLTNSGTISAPEATAIFNYSTVVSVVESDDSPITYYGTIGTITNTKLITGDYGIGNEGSITAVYNAGTISAVHTALYNYNQIGMITNTGTITGEYGIGTNGTIGSINNIGTIATEGTSLFNYDQVDWLSNSGTIYAMYDTGVYNSGNFGTLTNLAGGTIAGLYNGIYNAGTIGNLNNAGLISGNSGLYSYAGSFGSIANSGTITGQSYDGFYLSGYAYTSGDTTTLYETNVGALTNSGLISGAFTGIYNAGNIGTLLNTGTISGSIAGIVNDGFLHLYDYDDSAARTQVEGESYSTVTASITTLANSGLISGGDTGIYNAGYIGAINNSGTIYGSIAGIYEGTSGGEKVSLSVIKSALPPSTTTSGTPGTIGVLTNTGLIEGATGIYLSGGGTTIINGGTIASTDSGDALYFGGVNDLILTTGSDIIGTIDGGGTDSQIALEGIGSLDAPIANFGAGGALGVTQGADWTGTGNWTIPTVTNDGIFQGGRVGTPLTLTGNFVQNADGTLRVAVTPTESSVFNISGSASLSGTVNYILAPGRYEPHTYIYLTSSNLNGFFSSINYGDIPSALVEKAVVTTQTLQEVGDPAVALIINVPFFVPVVIAPEDSSIFSDQTQALAATADADTASLLSKAIYGGAASSPACAAETPLSPDKTAPGGTTQSGQIASALASVFCGAGGWIEATGSLSEADSSAGAPSYNANTAGFLAGVDKVLDPAGTRLGFAIGYDQTFLSDKLGGSGSMGTTRVAVYGSQPLGAFTLAGVIAYGNANNSTSRVSGIGNLHENNNASMFSGGFEISTDLIEQNIELVPAAGMRVATIGAGGKFAEAATGLAVAYAVSGETSGYTSVQPYAVVNASKSFLLPSGWTLRPNAEAGYEYEAGTHGVSTTLFGPDGTVFQTPHNDLDPSDALLSAGVTAGKANWSLFATYTAHLSGNWNTQTAEAGLRYTF